MHAITSPEEGLDDYRRLLDTAPDAIVVIDADARIVLVNVQTETLFGYARFELLGQPLSLLVPERFQESHGEHVARFFDRPEARPMRGRELFGRRKDGTEVPIEVSLSPLATAGRMTVSAAIRDITDRKRLERELHEARIAAEAGSAAKTEFLSSMSHELRTPLNAILGFAQLLQRDRKVPLGAHHRARVDQIVKGGEHLLCLIDDILDLSRIEAGALAISTEPVNVAEVLDEVTRTLAPLGAKQGLRIVAEAVPFDLPLVSADRTRFVQILMNYGSNAVKYNRPSGEIHFLVLAVGHERVRVTVKDSGIGIPVPMQAKLFQPFQRAGQENGPIQGTGIGLVITKRLAELMGGAVGFRSAPGEGSEFWVDLPVGEDGVSAPEARASTVTSLAVEGDRLVVYVEDNPANVRFMRDLIGSLDNIELVTVPTAELGIDLARARKPALVILDINLPGMSGFEAIAVLRGDDETRNIPVIALTAAASERDRQRGKDAGFHCYLTKPVRVDELVEALEVLLG